jgi:hypothetical protein
MPFFKSLFPTFMFFMFFAVFVGAPVAIYIGRIYFRRALYKAQQDVQIASNPYATKIVQPASIPLYEMLAQLAEAHGLDTTSIRKIISDSKAAVAEGGAL